MRSKKLQRRWFLRIKHRGVIHSSIKMLCLGLCRVKIRAQLSSALTNINADAHSSCALYMAKNRVNSPIIFRSIESRVNDLLSAPPPITPLDCLAHTQALILYQIIRLYDGDIGARTSAERIIPAIEASAMSLFSYAQFDIEGTPGTLPLYPIAPTKAF